MDRHPKIFKIIVDLSALMCYNRGINRKNKNDEKEKDSN